MRHVAGVTRLFSPNFWTSDNTNIGVMCRNINRRHCSGHMPIPSRPFYAVPHQVSPVEIASFPDHWCWGLGMRWDCSTESNLHTVLAHKSPPNSNMWYGIVMSLLSYKLYVSLSYKARQTRFIVLHQCPLPLRPAASTVIITNQWHANF